MEIPIYQIDAFAGRPFTGNPAAVCPLDRWLDDATMQAIAAENNLAETAFFVSEDGGFRLRWFTPAVEVDVCGHATLASAYVLINELAYPSDVIHFHTRSGQLTVTRRGDLFELDFPARPPQPCSVHPDLIRALGAEPSQVLAARDYLVVYDSEEQVRQLQPNMSRLMDIDRFAVIVTAPGRDYDFVSRFFAPAKGVPEDPVTGSAHCTLIPYWALRLNKNGLRAFQASPRGGEVTCEFRGDRVGIAGRARPFLRGHITIEA